VHASLISQQLTSETQPRFPHVGPQVPARILSPLSGTRGAVVVRFITHIIDELLKQSSMLVANDESPSKDISAGTY
jgi:hypothetical protein